MYGVLTNMVTRTERTSSIQRFAPGRTLRPQAKVLPEHARRHNRSLVLQMLYAEGQISRADIARRTRLTRVTVSDLVGALIDEGLVVETGTRTDVRPGKPATLLVDRPDGIPDRRDRPLGPRALPRRGARPVRARRARHEIPLAEATGQASLDLVVELTRTLLAAADRPVLGVGIGSPGVVNTAGVVLSAPNLGWHDLELQRIVEETFTVPVQVANDANAAVLAEHSFGSARGDLMLVKIGHGVGAGLLLGGSPFFGSNFAAGEIGHVVVGTDGGRPCVCGKVGCLETWLSAPRLQSMKQAQTGDGRSRRRAA